MKLSDLIPKRAPDVVAKSEDDALFAVAQMDPEIVRDAKITNGMSAAEILRRILEVAKAR